MSGQRHDAAQGRLADALTEALANVEAPTQLVGRTIPPAARKWAERHGLDVAETRFAPPGQLFIVGAVPVALHANDLFEEG